jgi:hypothetical protein
VSLVRHQRRRYELDILQDEIRKFKPPTFDGEKRRVDDDKKKNLGIKNYFQLHNYSSNLEAKIFISSTRKSLYVVGPIEASQEH